RLPVLTSRRRKAANHPRTDKNKNRGSEMRKMLLTIALMLGALPASAADEHAKVLIDAASNLATANWKVSSAEWGGKAAWSAQLRTLHGGRQEGVQVIEVDNGAMTFSIVPTRGFEIGKAEVL